MMSKVYPVRWQRVFASLTKVITFLILVPLVCMMSLRYVMHGFNYAKTFEHVSLPGFLLVLACVPLGSAVFAFLIAIWFRFAGITLTDVAISGRNYWFLKNRIPLSDITDLSHFSSNGINAFVVHSCYHGKIYISDMTEDVDELLTLVSSYLPDSDEEDGSEV